MEKTSSQGIRVPICKDKQQKETSARFPTSQLFENKQHGENLCLDRALEELIIPAASTGRLVVADLGSSFGISSIKNVNHIVSILRSRSYSDQERVPEILACFNNLPSSDFNSLFQLLAKQPPGRQFFISGVPGSCYGRLFPRSYVNVFLSTNTIHWLSEVPATVLDENSSAYNGKQGWLDGSTKDIIDEFKKQAMKNLKVFLKARATELIAGGLLCCVFDAASENSKLCPTEWLRPLSEDSPTTSITLPRAMEHVWSELVSEGILTPSQTTSFYLPTCKLAGPEILEVLEEFRDLFEVRKFVTTEIRNSEILVPTAEIGIGLATTARNIYGPLLSTHLGSDIAEIFLTRLEKFVSTRSPNADTEIVSTSHVLLLIRK